MTVGWRPGPNGFLCNQVTAIIKVSLLVVGKLIEQVLAWWVSILLGQRWGSGDCPVVGLTNQQSDFTDMKDFRGNKCYW